jgi:hypothetical protein
MAMGRSIQRQDLEHYWKAYTGGGRGVDSPSVFGSDDEWKAFYREMRKHASTDEDAADWAERAKRVLQDRRLTAGDSAGRFD